MQLTPVFSSPYRAFAARMIAPPTKFGKFDSGVAFTLPVNEPHGYMFGCPPFDGSFVVKGRRTIYYYNSAGSLVPPLTVPQPSATSEVFFITFNTAVRNVIEYYYGVLETTSRLLSIYSVKTGVNNYATTTTKLVELTIPNYGATSLNSSIFLDRISGLKGMVFDMLINTTVNGSVMKRVLNIHVEGATLTDTELTGLNGRKLSSALYTYRTLSRSDKNGGIYAGAIRRNSETDSDGVISLLHCGSHFDVIYPNNYGIPVPTINPTLKPYQRIVPVTMDVIGISSSVSDDGATVGGSSPHQRMFDRMKFDEWMRFCCENGGCIWDGEWYGKEFNNR